MAIPTNIHSADAAAVTKQKQIFKNWKPVSLYIGKVEREMDKNHM